MPNCDLKISGIDKISGAIIMFNRKWLSFLCPWFTIDYPDCETCEFYYVIHPGDSDFCLWDHGLTTIKNERGENHRTPIGGKCRDYRNNEN